MALDFSGRELKHEHLFASFEFIVVWPHLQKVFGLTSNYAIFEEVGAILNHFLKFLTSYYNKMMD